MKKGINMYAIPGNWTYAQAFEAISKAGFDGVELNMEEKPRENGDLILHTNNTQAELSEIKSLAEKNNLKITGCVTGLLWSCPLSSNDAATREKGKTAIKKMIDYSVFFGSDCVLVVPGYVNESSPYDCAYENALASLKELAPYAEQNKISLGVENVWNKFLLSPLEMRNFVDEVGSDYVGAYFDIGNVVKDGFPEQWIKILGKRIKKFHAKGYGHKVGFTKSLNDEGVNINWKKVMEEIRLTGYNDFISAELGSDEANQQEFLNLVAKEFEDIFSM